MWKGTYRRFSLYHVGHVQAGNKCSLIILGSPKGACITSAMNQKIGSGRGKRFRERLLIWVLQDYDRQQWVLKDTVSFLKLFGKRNCHLPRYNVVGIHPDHNLVFLVQHWDRKLISHHMDSKAKCAISGLLDMDTSASFHMFSTSRSLALENKQSNYCL